MNKIESKKNWIRKTISAFFIFLFSISFLHAQVRIKMKNENGVYTTPCTVNGLRLSFIFDTGASTVSLSLSEAAFMLKNDYMDESDLRGSSYSQIANGDIVKNTTVIIRELEIGGIILRNIEAVIIHELSAPLLLGQSAINKLGKIQIDGDELVIISGESALSDNACLEAQKLIKEAAKYFLDRLGNLAADTYQRAYDLCPNVFDCFDVYFMGDSYYSSGNYILAIQYLEKAAKCITDKETLFFIFITIGTSYQETENYEKAILNIQKALVYATGDKHKGYCYNELGHIYLDQKKYYEALSNYEKSADYQLNYLSFTLNDMAKGKVKDEVLGEIYWNISTCYLRLNQKSNADLYKITSSLCGYEEAIEYCKIHELNYYLK